MSKLKLYLLGGNGSNASWWKFVIPYFKNYEPVAVELPGFGSNTSHFHNNYSELAHSLISQTEPDNKILACGINALTVLHSVTINPSHFSKITLLSPVGAFLWERKIVKLMSVPGATALLKFFLPNFPKLFKNKFTDSEWNDENFNIISNGYKECRAFKSYFNFTSAINALDLFDYIKSDIRIIWGAQDRIVGVNHLAAWDTILKRANLSMTIKKTGDTILFLILPKNFVRLLKISTKDFIHIQKPEDCDWQSFPGLTFRSLKLLNTRIVILKFLMQDYLWFGRVFKMKTERMNHQRVCMSRL